MDHNQELRNTYMVSKYLTRKSRVLKGERIVSSNNNTEGKLDSLFYTIHKKLT